MPLLAYLWKFSGPYSGVSVRSDMFVVMGTGNAQEELDSYEGTMRSHHGLGKGRVPTELSEIGRVEGSMT